MISALFRFLRTSFARPCALFKGLKTKERLLLLLIIAIAAFLRLYRIDDYMTFLGDEGRDVLIVRHILHGDLTLLGPTASVGGFFLGPIYYYFMAPFLLLFNYHPVGPAVMVALFGIATVFLVYKIGSILFENRTAGLVAATLYAISPVVIAYSRSSWNPNPMPFFSFLTLFTCYKGIEKNKESYFLLSGFLLGITLQLHYLATFIGAVLFVYLLVSELLNKENNWLLKLIKRYLLIFLGFLLGLSPFLAFEARHGFPNTQSIFKFIFTSGDINGNGNFIQITSNVFFRLFGRLVMNFPPPEQVSLQAHIEIKIWYFVTIVLGILSVGLFLFQFYKTNRRGEAFLKRLLIFTWFFVVLILFGFYKKPIYDYYFGLIFPLPFLFVGNLFSELFKRKVLLKAIVVVSLAIIIYVNLQGVPFRFPPNGQYYQVKAISEFVLTKANGKPFNFALITGGNSDHAYRYIFEVENKSPVTIQNIQIDPQRKSTTDQLFIVCETLPCHPLGESLWEVAGFGRAEIVGEWPVSVVQVYKLIHYKGK